MLFCAELLLSAASANIFKLEALCLLLLQTTNPVSSSRAFLLLLFDFLKKSDFITSARFFPPNFFFIFFCFCLNVWVRSCATSKWMLFICVAYTSSCTGKKKACLFTNVIWWAGSLLNSGKLLLMPLENRDNAANLNYRKNVKKKKIFLYWEIINN